MFSAVPQPRTVAGTQGHSVNIYGMNSVSSLTVSWFKHRVEVTKRSSDLYPGRHRREAVTQRTVRAVYAVSNVESYWLFSLQNCVETSLCRHSSATIYLLMSVGCWCWVLSLCPIAVYSLLLCDPVVGDSAVW